MCLNPGFSTRRLGNVLSVLILEPHSQLSSKDIREGVVYHWDYQRHGTAVCSDLLLCSGWMFSCSEFPHVLQFVSAQEKTALKLLVGMNVSVSDSLSTCVSPVMDVGAAQGVNFAWCSLCASPTPCSRRGIRRWRKGMTPIDFLKKSCSIVVYISFLMTSSLRRYLILG